MGVDVNSPAKLVDLKAAGVVDPARVTKKHYKTLQVLQVLQ